MKKAELLAMMPFARATGVELASAKRSEVVGRLAWSEDRSPDDIAPSTYCDYDDKDIAGQARPEVHFQRADEAFYFANSTNRASIDLHEQFGFREMMRDFRYPHCTFRNGIGILFRLELG